MFSMVWISLLSGVLALPAEAEQLPTYRELRENYRQEVSTAVPLHAECKMVIEHLGVGAKQTRYEDRIEGLRRTIATISEENAAERAVKADLQQEIASLKFAIKHAPERSELFYQFLTDGESFQLRWAINGCEKIHGATPAPNSENLAEDYPRILLYSFSPAAEQPRHRLWCGLSENAPTGQVSRSPFLYGPYQGTPVGHLNTQWGDASRFSPLDQIMTLEDADSVSVTREGQAIVVEAIQSEANSTVTADGQSGTMKQQEFLRAYIQPKHAPWPTLVERGRRRFFNGVLLNERFPEILETTEVTDFQSFGAGVYPRKIVETHYEFHGGEQQMPKLSHYVDGGTFDIPYKPVRIETLHISLRERRESDADIEYSLSFPEGTKCFEHAMIEEGAGE